MVAQRPDGPGHAIGDDRVVGETLGHAAGDAVVGNEALQPRSLHRIDPVRGDEPGQVEAAVVHLAQHLCVAGRPNPGQYGEVFRCQ
jgi:hypothetical protein